jgi:hypothetical protein
MDHNPFGSHDGEDNPLAGLFNLLRGMSSGDGHDSSDFSDNSEFQALMAGDPEQLARCARCPVQDECPIWAAYQASKTTASTPAPGLTAEALSNILRDRRVAEPLRKIVDLGVYAALEENDFLQDTIVAAMLAYDEAKAEQKKEAARKFWGGVWKVVTFPFRALFYIVIAPFALLFGAIMVLFEAFTWRQTDVKIDRMLVRKNEFMDFLPDFIKAQMGLTRDDIINSLNPIERWGYKLGRWVYNTTHRQPSEAPVEDSQPVEPAPAEESAQSAESPAVEIDLGKAAQAADENLLKPNQE